METDSLSDREIIARTAYGEARSLGHDGMQATICTGQNRLASGVTWWGNSLRTIFLKPWQYSCWNENDPNRPKLLAVTEADLQYKIALELADDALGGTLPDNVAGADSYYATTLAKLPFWCVGLTPCAKIGNQLYFKTIDNTPLV